VILAAVGEFLALERQKATNEAVSTSSRRRRSSAKTKRTVGQSVAAIIMGMVLLALGLALLFSGRRAIVERYFEMAWHSSSGMAVGPFAYSQPENGLMVLEDSEAMRFGTGLCAFGTMFCLWALGMIASLFFPPTGPGQTSALGRVVTWLSFVCLLLTILDFFPPWLAQNIPFYAVSILLVYGGVASSRNSSSPNLKRVFPVVIGIAVVAGMLGFAGVTTQVIVAIFAMLIVGVHVLVLVPSLMTELTAKDKAHLAKIPTD